MLPVLQWEKNEGLFNVLWVFLTFVFIDLAVPGLSCVTGILAVACEILVLSCGNWPGMEPGPPALGAWSLATGPPGSPYLQVK